MYTTYTFFIYEKKKNRTNLSMKYLKAISIELIFANLNIFRPLMFTNTKLIFLIP